MKKALLLLLVLPALASCGDLNIVSKWATPNPCICKFHYGYFGTSEFRGSFEDSCKMYKVGDKLIKP
mgnify:FL=1